MAPPALALVVMLEIGSSCVPAGEDLAPKGAVGLVTEPSPATRGEPFFTDDGWNVRIDKLALITRVSASKGPAGEDEEEEEGEEDGRYMWNGAARAELLVRAVPVGPCSVIVALQGAGRRFDGNGVEEPTYVNLGVEPTLEARLKTFEDVAPPGGPGKSIPGPTVVLVARGERAGQVVVLDVALSISSPPSPEPNMTKSDVAVRANDVTFAHLDVAAERLLGGDPSTGRGAAFQPIADADTRSDGDGRVTETELRGVDPTLLERITIAALRVLSIR